jgi:hypothetical protein
VTEIGSAVMAEQKIEDEIEDESAVEEEQETETVMENEVDAAIGDVSTGKNYRVIHQERLNDGIHTTNVNQRNGALEDIMREIADQTNG